MLFVINIKLLYFAQKKIVFLISIEINFNFNLNYYKLKVNIILSQ
jgi:hypothetical protein